MLARLIVEGEQGYVPRNLCQIPHRPDRILAGPKYAQRRSEGPKGWMDGSFLAIPSTLLPSGAFIPGPGRWLVASQPACQLEQTPVCQGMALKEKKKKQAIFVGLHLRGWRRRHSRHVAQLSHITGPHTRNLQKGRQYAHGAFLFYLHRVAQKHRATTGKPSLVSGFQTTCVAFAPKRRG